MRRGSSRRSSSWVTVGLFVVGIAVLVWTTLTYLSQEYVLTNRRVIQVSGVVNKRAVDSSLEKINDAVLTQSIFGRALDFGDLEILTASDAAISDFHMLMHPIEFKKAMLDAKHEYETDVAGGSMPTAHRCVPRPRPRRPGQPLRRRAIGGAALGAGAAGDATVSTGHAGGRTRLPRNASTPTR